MKLMTVFLFSAVLVGCTSKEDAKQLVAASESPSLVARVLSPFGKRHNGHPTVAHWYYSIHAHPFDCRDAPEHDDYSCKSCPVGAPDRVVTFPHGDYRDVPIAINAYFACASINMLIPEPSSEVDSDQFYCERNPPDGFVVLDGHKISCAGQDRGTEVHVGDVAPGQTVTVPIVPQAKQEGDAQ